MKLLLLGICLFYFLSDSEAQDTLFLKDGKVLLVKVYKIRKHQIEYKFNTNLDGPMLNLASRKLRRIGLEQLDVKKNIALYIDSLPITYEQRIGVDAMQFGKPYPIFPSQFYYERLSEKGYSSMSYFANLFVLGYEQSIYGYGVGVNLKFYRGKGEGFYYGPLIEVGEIGLSESNLFTTKGPTLLLYGAGDLGWKTSLSKRLYMDIGVSLGLAYYGDNLFRIMTTIHIGFAYAFKGKIQ